MPSPATRVLTLLELLQSRRHISGAELAEHLNVNRRTVRRYITMLEDLGVPVSTEQGRFGGYMLTPGYKLPPMMFTDEETLAISLGLLAARQLGLADVAPAIESVQAKLERVMPEKLKQRVRGVGTTTRVVLPRPAPMLDKSVLLVLSRAIDAGQRVGFIYHAPDKDDAQRQVNPYGLVFRRGNWYMSGFCHLRQALRSFRLDRISDAAPLPHFFARPAGFDAEEHFMSSLLALPRNHEVAVVLGTDAETAAGAFCFHPHAAGLFQPHPDGVLLKTRTDSVEWFASWLVCLPFPFTVQGPPELKQALRDHVQRLLAACAVTLE